MDLDRVEFIYAFFKAQHSEPLICHVADLRSFWRLSFNSTKILPSPRIPPPPHGIHLILILQLTSVTILGSENCQSISLQNLLSASQPFPGLWLNTVSSGCKAAAIILPHYCTPHNLSFMSLWPDKAQGYKVRSSQITFLPVIFHPSPSWWLADWSLE